MTIFYVPTKSHIIPNKKTNHGVTINMLQRTIDKTPHFCGNEESIEAVDLKYYLQDGVTIFSKTNDTINGILNFNVNVHKMMIKGLCVSVRNKRKGYPSDPRIGSSLLREAKRFAKRNNLSEIHLTCYGDVFQFYEKHGFIVQRKSALSVDSDDSFGSPKQSYFMVHQVSQSALSHSFSKKNSAAKRVTKFFKKKLGHNKTSKSSKR
jgi:hypothetical protein